MEVMDHVDDVCWQQLIRRAQALSHPDRPAILGIAGKPGVGKSTFAASLASAIPGVTVLAPMDGFHLSNEVLADLGLLERKGAPETFDVWGYLALLERLHGNHHMARGTTPIVYAPSFDRVRDEAIAGAIAIPLDTPLVITEGNYLLLDQPPWNLLRGLLDEAWYLDLPDPLRRTRLEKRHASFGKNSADAHHWATHSDEHNALLVAPTASDATLHINLQDWTPRFAQPATGHLGHRHQPIARRHVQ